MQFIRNNTEQTLYYNAWLLNFNMKITTLRRVNLAEVNIWDFVAQKHLSKCYIFWNTDKNRQFYQLVDIYPCPKCPLRLYATPERQKFISVQSIQEHIQSKGYKNKLKTKNNSLFCCLVVLNLYLNIHRGTCQKY